MQQHTRRLAIILGASLLTTIGVLAACSTDNGTTPLPGQTGDGGGGGGKDGSKSDGNTVDPDDDSGTKPKDGGADCSAAPKPRSNDGVFCFGGAGSNDGGQCDPAENKVCCADEKDSSGQFVPSKCAVATVGSEGYNAGSCNLTPDAGGREWHCTEAAHCPNSGETCCVIAGWGGSPQAQPDTKDFPGCGNFFNSASDFFVGGSRCRSGGCNAAELTLCSSDDECGNGTTCHFFKLANRFTGVCK